MNLVTAFNSLPHNHKKVISVLSGGLDSSVMTMLLVERYTAKNVVAVSYDYGQKQKIELTKAAELCEKLGISHRIIDLSILGEIVKPVSANIGGTDVEMPNIQDVLGDPQPPTYVPFRNMILLSLTMSIAEVEDASHVFTGLQVHDEYGYWDTSQLFVDTINSVAIQNRTHKVEVVAPFSHLSKAQEIELCKEMNKLDLLKSTLTCYNPNENGESCGTCPSCAERIMNFMKVGIIDPIPYQIEIPWKIN